MKDSSVESLLAKTVNELRKNQFQAEYFVERKDLVNTVFKLIPPGSTVGVGGSVSIRELKLVDYLRERGFILFDHWQEGLSTEEKKIIRKKQVHSHVFISGVNAITEKGEIVNMDGVGNRVASMIFGPEKVILVAGHNKIVKDLNEAINRIRNIAAPMNAKRLNLPLPCAEIGHCTDCTSDKRICRILTVIQRKPPETDIWVLLLKEKIGF